MSKTNFVYGLDMAPTHGALAQVTFDDECKPVEYKPIAHYTGWEWKDLGYGTAFLMCDARKRAEWLRIKVSTYDVAVPSVYVDFTIQGTAFLPSGKIYAAKWCFIMGGFFTLSHDNLISMLPVTPARVRAHFGLNARVKKEEIYMKFRDQYPRIYKQITEVRQPKAIRQDYLDAALLAIVGGS